MSEDTKDFLAALLFDARYQEDQPNEELDLSGWTIYQFSLKFVKEAEKFIDGFVEYLSILSEERHEAMDALNSETDTPDLSTKNLEVNTGHSIYLGLSGSGVGFGDDPHPDAELIKKALKSYAYSGTQFEELSSFLWMEDGEISLAFSAQYLEEYLERSFRTSPPEKRLSYSELLND